MLAVVVLLAVLATLVVVRFDYRGVRTRQTLERLTTFLRARQAAAIRTGVTRRVRVTSDPLRVSVTPSGDGRSDTMSLPGWSLDEPDRPVSLWLTPSGTRGRVPLTLMTENGRRFVLRPHRILVLESKRTSGDRSRDL